MEGAKGKREHMGVGISSSGPKASYCYNRQLYH